MPTLCFLFFHPVSDRINLPLMLNGLMRIFMRRQSSVRVNPNITTRETGHSGVPVLSYGVILLWSLSECNIAMFLVGSFVGVQEQCTSYWELLLLVCWRGYGGDATLDSESCDILYHSGFRRLEVSEWPSPM